MHYPIRAAVLFAASMSLITSTVDAQTAVALDVQASTFPQASSSAPALAADGPPPIATAVTATDANTPLIDYVKHTKPPVLVDTTAGSAGFALIGAAVAIASGHAIVVDNAIQDPSGDMAHELATAYAAAHGDRVADAPIPDDHLWTRAKSETLVQQSSGASYVVDVDPPGMTLIYFPLDWKHYDLTFMSGVRIIDTSDGKIVAKTRCYLKSQKTPGAMTHGELLANGAVALKQLIVSKSEACVAQMKAGLKL